MLFSATTTKKVKDLETLALKSDPVYVGVDDLEEKATVSGLEQGWVFLVLARTGDFGRGDDRRS